MPPIAPPLRNREVTIIGSVVGDVDVGTGESNEKSKVASMAVVIKVESEVMNDGVVTSAADDETTDVKNGFSREVDAGGAPANVVGPMMSPSLGR